MPRMLHKANMESFPEWLYAHRGLHDNTGDAPENSMEAFKKAVDAGYGMELDVQLTKDLVPVVFHDYTLERMCGVEGYVKDYTYEELQQFTLSDSEQQIPKFADVLALVKGSRPLIIEYKSENNENDLYIIADKLLQEYQGMYCIESFNPLCLKWYRKNRPKVARGQLSEAFYRGDERRGILYFALQYLLLNFIGRPDFIAYNHKHQNIISRRLCRSLFGNTAVAWTIQSTEQLAEARKHFDMFIFDSFDPELGRK